MRKAGCACKQRDLSTHIPSITMKQIILALIASAATLSSHAQNLVPNPSFEEYLECPFSTAELDNQVIDWYSWQESPDFFHVCSNDIDGFAGVPENAWGNQLPISGDGYAGVYTYVEYFENGREYIAAELLAPLVPGNSYYMMFFASMYDGGSKESRLCANSNIGMRFFKDPQYSAFPPDINPLHPDNFAHLNYGEILDDYTNWTLIEGWYTADDDYNWVAIGNFFTDDQTEIEILNDEGTCSGIYYIENVCVASSPEECEFLVSANSNITMMNASIYPNPANEIVRINVPETGKFNLEIFDLQGRSLKSLQNVQSEQEFSISTFQNGTYLLRVSNNHYFTTLKLVIQ